MRHGLVFILMLSVTGCGGGLHRNVQPTQVYVLRAAPPQAAGTTASTATLRIGRTSSAPGLNSDRIVIVRPDRRMDYYAASRWAATVPEVVEALAVETMRATGAWAAVNDSQGAFPADYFLQIAIRRFEADYTTGADPEVHVSLDCSIGRRIDRELVASFIAEGSAQAGENRLSAVVAAFEKASQTALAGMAERALEAVKAAAAAPQAGSAESVSPQ